MTADLSDEKYRLFERAAIIEYDGNLPREIAEEQAIRQEVPGCPARTLVEWEEWRKKREAKRA